MLIGYARTSTLDQQAGLGAQERDLNAAGVGKLFSEQVSSVAERLVLEAAIDYLREGDTLVATKIDRLARSTSDLLRIAERVKAKGARLLILSPRLEMSGGAGAIGELIFNVIGAIAQFERQMMLERQREGIAKAKAEGKYKGRAPKAREKAPEAVRMVKDGKTITETAEALGISRASVYRAVGISQASVNRALEAAGIKNA